MKIKNLNDWVVALAVIVCSVGLFLAMLLALTGGAELSSRPLVIDFEDVMGVNPGASVKWAGARVGTVSEIRMLSEEERAASPNPLNVVRVTVELDDEVPAIPSDIAVSVTADTLLSDKIILLSGGTLDSPPLAPGGVLQGIAPATIDQLARNLDDTLQGVNDLLGGAGADAPDLMQQLQSLLAEAQAVVSEARPLVKEARGLMGEVQPLVEDARGLVGDTRPLVEDVRGLANEARQLVAENKDGISRAVSQLDSASRAVEGLIDHSDQLIFRLNKSLISTLADLDVTVKNFKVTSTYTKILGRNLTEHPTRLLWGGKAPPLPSEAEILRTKAPLVSDE